MNQIRITSLEYQWVEDFKFYRLWYVIDEQYAHLAFIQPRQLVDGDIVGMVVSALRAKLDCIPKELVYDRT